MLLRHCRSWLVAALIGLGLATAISFEARAQDKVVISGGADVTALNGVELIIITPDRMLMDHIGDTLLRWEAPGKLGPWLATSWSNIDATTWELKLRQGVKFHNGEAFDANAVKFFYDYITDPKTVSPTKSNHAFVKEVQILDPFTVRIITNGPYPIAPNQFALAHMIPPEYFKRVGIDGYRRRPVGSGPYRLVEHVKDDHITLEAFDGFWGGPQKIKTIVYRPIKEDAARVSALLAGEIDLALDVPPELIPLVEKSRNAKIKQVMSIRTFCILLNSINPEFPTTRREVREAISYAIDREALAKHILLGTGAPASWISPTTFGFNPALKPLTYEPDRARRLLAEAGYPGGIDIVFDTSQGKYMKDKEIAEAMAGQMAKAGIRASVKVNDWGLLTKRIFSHKASPITLIGWGDANGDPESHNRLALKSGATWSHTNDPKLDGLLARQSLEMDREKRRQLMFEQQDYMRESFPMVYAVQMGIIVGLSQKLAWWEPRPDERFYLFQARGVR